MPIQQQLDALGSDYVLRNRPHQPILRPVLRPKRTAVDSRPSTAGYLAPNRLLQGRTDEDKPCPLRATSEAPQPDLASQVRAIAVKDVAAIAGGYPAWESPSTTKPFAFDSNVVDPHQCAIECRFTAVHQTIH